jgi:hypothetical protein
LDNDNNKLTELEFLAIDLINCSSNANMELLDELWNKIGEKFGTKRAIDIYNEGCQYQDCPATEQDFIESYMRN